MPVMIEEMVHERPEEATRAPIASGGGGRAAAQGEGDFDRIFHQLARRRQRARRLWAD